MLLEHCNHIDMSKDLIRELFYIFILIFRHFKFISEKNIWQDKQMLSNILSFGLWHAEACAMR